MADDLLKQAEKYVRDLSLTEQDIADAPRLVRRLAGALAARVEHGGDPVTEAQLVVFLDEATMVVGANSETVAKALMEKFVVRKK